MSRAVKPTRRQKELINANKLDYRNWLVVKDNEKQLKIVSKSKGITRTIKKIVNFTPSLSEFIRVYPSSSE